MRRREFLKSAAAFASALAFGQTADAAKSGSDRPNILWITCEDICPYLGCYGDTEATTPNLDRLAGQGVLYTHAYSPAPVCSPSRSCLITGVYATSMGTQHLRSSVKIPSYIKCFPQYLRQAGYYCSNNYKKDYNFTDVGAWDESSHEAHWRKRKPGQPFFSVFNFESTHQGKINGSDEDFFKKYGSKLRPDERHRPEDITLPPYYPDTPVVRKIWARYYDLITYMDHQVGDLLGQLEADGLSDNTIVFFFSDHGMGLPRFKRTLYDSGLHVPLIMRFPKKFASLSPAAAGKKIDRLVSFVDFAPTMLSITGLAIPEYMQGRVFLGPAAGPPREYIFASASRVDEAYEVSRCVRDKRYKYIRNYMPHLPYFQPSEYPDRAEIMQELRRVAKSGSMTAVQQQYWRPGKPLEELYDTQSDPYEVHNLADSAGYRDTLWRMRKRLRQWMLDIRDIGFLPEAEMHIRSEAATPYEIARDAGKYPLERILSAAELVGRGPDKLDEMEKMLADSDAAARYWAAVALGALGEKAVPAADALGKALNDSHPNVRFAAAGALCRLGRCGRALAVLAEGLKAKREETVLAAAREIELSGDRVCGITAQMKAAQARCRRPDGEYKNMNHAWFIDWALKYALKNCGRQ